MHKQHYWVRHKDGYYFCSKDNCTAKRWESKRYISSKIEHDDPNPDFNSSTTIGFLVNKCGMDMDQAVNTFNEGFCELMEKMHIAK